MLRRVEVVKEVRQNENFCFAALSFFGGMEKSFGIRQLSRNFTFGVPEVVHVYVFFSGCGFFMPLDFYFVW